MSLVSKLLIVFLGFAADGTVLVAKGATVAQDDEISFNEKVRPILSNRCFACHGPDPETVEGGLRLDGFDFATSKLDSGQTAIVPGQPNSSELLHRIVASDTNSRMPPPHFANALSVDEVSTLTKWIEQGAKYQKHWSFEPLVRSDPPAIESNDSLREQSVVDGWILHTARKRFGVLPVHSSEADRSSLLRRLCLALTGLPPSVERLRRFVTDERPMAYELQVDELIASPEYAEHWARLWLDLARYADSNGYADDGPRTIWAYRDWVIRAIHQNLPFDQFTREQLAGDLLPNPSDDQLIATAFHRNTLTNNEGGTNDEEFRNVAVVDRVNTTISVWMGLTMACAQCHTHKYDPIPQKEYFELFAAFNQTQDADRRDEAPRFSVFTQERKNQLDALTKERDSFAKRLKESADSVAGQQGWEKLQLDDLVVETIHPQSITASSGDLIDLKPNGDLIARQGRDSDTYDVIWKVPSELSLQQISRIRISTQPWPAKQDRSLTELPKSFFLSDFRATIDTTVGGEKRRIEWKIDNAIADSEWADRVASKAIDGNAETGWAVDPQYDSPHWIEFRMAPPKDVAPSSDETPTYVRFIIEQAPTYLGHVLANFRLSYSTVPLDPVRESTRAPTGIRSIVAVAPEQRSPSQKSELSKYYLRHHAPEYTQERLELDRLDKEIQSLAPTTDLPIMRELPSDQRRDTFVQKRGNYKAQGEKVSPGVLKAFHPLSSPQGQVDRLTVANWLMQSDNPLTPRVVANRYWEQLFGSGLVRTSEDFGSQGDRPTHPELLDSLACYLIDSGWDTKKFVKMLVMSATFRQSSVANAESLSKDPENIYLIRGPRVRLTAEQIRDVSLFVGGLLSPKMFGPPVRPAQPISGLAAAFGGKTDWEASTGDDRYRRAIYTTWRRSNPYPSMATFDAPNRESCLLKRDRTNTPLQALVTLNDPTFVEAAQGLARRIVVESSQRTIEGRLSYAFECSLSRKPTDQEVTILTQFWTDLKSEFAKDEKSAEGLVTNPIGPLPDEIREREGIAGMAAWTTVGNALLNLDEVLMPK